MRPNERIYPLSKLKCWPRDWFTKQKSGLPVSYLIFQFSLMFNAVNAVCACQAGHAHGRQACSLERKRERHQGEKKISMSSFANLRKQPPGLRIPGAGIPSSFHSEVEAQRQHGFQREVFCAFFAVLNSNGPRVPEKTTGHAPGLTHRVPCVVLGGGYSPVAHPQTGSPYPLTANVPSSEGMTD